MDIFNSTSLLKQINKYNIIGQSLTDDTKQFSTISNQLIYQTMTYRENLKYWTSVKYSLIYKVYYGLQSLPWMVYKVYKKLEQSQFNYEILRDVNILKMIDGDINSNIKEIKTKLNDNYGKLGKLISEKDNLTSLNATDFDVSEIESIEPSFAVKYWIPISLGILLGPVLSLKVISNRNEIIDWLKVNVRDVVFGFYENWVISPIKDVINIIRQDSNIIMAKDSLNSSVESLERMVTQYLVDNKIDIGDLDIHKKVEAGDLTLIMSKYEKEMQNPIKNLINGTLIRSLLIQIQKTKVDGDLVINGIDKLIKSQQLLLGIVSISPSIFIIYQLVKYLYKPNYTVNGKDVKKSCFNNLVSLEESDGDISKGNLLINIIVLKIESKLCLNPYVFEMFENDLTKLLVGEGSLSDIYVIYTDFFR